MKERLTEDFYDDMQQITRHCVKSDNIDLNCGGDDFQDVIDRLAEYETAEEEGRLIVLPCKIGTIVYVLRQSWNGWNIDKKKFSYAMIGKVGKTVFLTREEAERTLEEMNKDIGTKLTKEQAIKEHRKMWNWIADQYKNRCIDYIYDVEQKYIDECTNYSANEIESNSFCCEYSNQNDVSDSCDSCPLTWGNVAGFAYCLDSYEINEDGDGRGLYAKIADETWDPRRVSSIARRCISLRSAASSLK